MSGLADAFQGDVFAGGEVVGGVDEALQWGERCGEGLAGAVVDVPAAHV